MSKDIIVLAPNGRRQKVHCTPNTSMLQVLEDVCEKQGFQSTEYALKHHNHLLDLTTSIRFSNLPNKATLEMVETDRKREESDVTIGLLLGDGERRTADFPPNTSLYEVVNSLAPTELSTFSHPAVLYMRQEVVGAPALRGTTLRQLGLIRGRAVLRLLNRPEEVKQANVSAVYRRSAPAPPPARARADATVEDPTKSNHNEPSVAGPSNLHTTFDPLKLLKDHKKPASGVLHSEQVTEDKAPQTVEQISAVINSETPMETDRSRAGTDAGAAAGSGTSTRIISQENLERRLRIEEEVTFLGAQKAVAFTQPTDTEDELEDLPDDFYELTVEEVRKLYKDLQQHRLELESTPLVTAAKRERIDKQMSHQIYKNVVVRVQFPDHIILQGVFSPTDTIEDVLNFIKDHLNNPNKPFHIFTTPLKEAIDPSMTLLEARFVPCVHMHFRWLELELEGDAAGQTFLREEIYLRQTSSEAASILASKYRAPSRRKAEDSSDSSQRSNMAAAATAASASGWTPKWFKN